MENRSVKTFGSITVIQHSDYKWGVVNDAGDEIVPFGKYDWIDDFDKGLARVKIGKAPNRVVNSNKWGIINEKGEEVLPVKYDNIWNFAGKDRYSTRAEINGKYHMVSFYDLNPELNGNGKGNRSTSDYKDYNSYNDYDDYGCHYGEYAGTYAQDVAGYSDDIINDVFEGDPDAYWNID